MLDEKPGCSGEHGCGGAMLLVIVVLALILGGYRRAS